MTDSLVVFLAVLIGAFIVLLFQLAWREEQKP